MQSLLNQNLSLLTTEQLIERINEVDELSDEWEQINWELYCRSREPEHNPNDDLQEPYH